MNKTVFILFFSIISTLCFGQFTSSPVLTEFDSVQIQLDLDKGIAYRHTIKAKQTLFSISQFFNISVQELLYRNDLTNESVISIGQVLQIPINSRHIQTSRSQPSRSVPVTYIVKPKETLFRLAKVYFPQKIEDLVERNQLADLSLSVNQTVVIGYYPLDGVDRLNETEYSEDQLTRVDTISQFEEMATTVTKTNSKSKNGIAIWNKSGSDKTNAFVLHRFAQVNTFIELYNPVVGRKTMAKVVGKLPEDYYESDVIMIMSPKVAESLGALDSRLMVEMTYRE